MLLLVLGCLSWLGLGLTLSDARYCRNDSDLAGDPEATNKKTDNHAEHQGVAGEQRMN